MKTRTKKQIARASLKIVSVTENVQDALWATFSPLLAIVILGGILAAVWYVPIWEVSTRVTSMLPSLSPKDRIDLENAARTTLVQFIGGTIVLIGSWIAYRNLKAVEQNVSVTRDSQITGRYAQAIEQLVSEKPEIRLGGIYALERIARDSQRDYGPIMEVLSSYVRSHRPAANADILMPISQDIQAIMTVLGRRAWGYEINGDGIDLRNVDLRNIDLRKAYLGDISFEGANLESANLTGADLDGTSLVEANLTFARLRDVDLSGVDLARAKLGKAILCGCDIRAAEHLTAAQVSSTFYDEKTLMTNEMKQSLITIWKQNNYGQPELLVDTAQAAVLGIQAEHSQNILDQ